LGIHGDEGKDDDEGDQAQRRDSKGNGPMKTVGSIPVEDGLALLAVGRQAFVHKKNIVEGITEVASDPVIHAGKPWPGMGVMGHA